MRAAQRVRSIVSRSPLVFLAVAFSFAALENTGAQQSGITITFDPFEGRIINFPDGRLAVIDPNGSLSMAGPDRAPIAACEPTAEKARLTCATMSTLGMDPQQAAMMEMMTIQATQMASQISQIGTNQSAQCQNQADLTKLLGLMSAAKGAGCAYTMKSCVASCEAEADVWKAMGRSYQEKERAARRRVNVCKQYQTNMMLTLMQSLNLGQNYLQNQACAQATRTNVPTLQSMAPPPPVEIPKPQDCSDPAFARGSLVCICRADPKNPLCGSSQQPSSVGGVGGVGGGATAAGGSASGPGTPFSAEEGGKGVAPDQTTAQAKSQSGSKTAGDGGGGSGLGGGGGASGGGGFDSGSGGGGSTGIDKNVITGEKGSSGIGGGGAGPGGGAGGGGALVRGGRASESEGGFNLKAFLPNKKDFKNRGIAGATIPAVDGITGPMGPSIWEKVSGQYQLQLQKSRFIQEP